MALDAVIFDLDGTLVDTNEAHARAFEEAFRQHGYRVGLDRIIQEIGKGGDKLVPYLLGEEAEAAHGQAIRDGHGERYLEIIEEEGASLLPGAVELIEALRARGLRTAIATGSKQRAMEHVMQHADVDLTARVDEVVSDADVEQTKPSPDAVQAAVDKLGLSPAQCAMVGDTPYDAVASRRVGVVCLGVATGVHSTERMRRAGMRAVYKDTADLLEHLDEALQLVSPGSTALTQERLTALMDEALAEARAALEQDELPVGSVLARPDGSVLVRGHNQARAQSNRLAHAELQVLQQIDRVHMDGGTNDLVLVTTLEPCVMCYGAAMNAGIDTIVYGLPAPLNGGAERCTPIESPGTVVPRSIGGVRADACRALLATWQERHPDHAFTRQLLARVA